MKLTRFKNLKVVLGNSSVKSIYNPPPFTHNTTILQGLQLRQNLIHDTAIFGDFVTLQELDLYDNRIPRITGLDRLVELRLVIGEVRFWSHSYRIIINRINHIIPEISTCHSTQSSI